MQLNIFNRNIKIIITFPLITEAMKEYHFCNQSNNFIMQKGIFVITFISRDCISKQVYIDFKKA